MAPAMSTPVRIAGERSASSGEPFTFGFGWTKPTFATRFRRAAGDRRSEREPHRRPVDGHGRSS